MRQPLCFSQNEHAYTVARAYVTALRHLIPDDCPATLGCMSKEELVQRHCIDNVQHIFRGALSAEETETAVTDDRILPGFLCYRSLDALDGPIVGAECRVQLLDPQRGIGDMWTIYHQLVELGWMEEIFTRVAEDSCKIAGRLNQFHISTNVGRSILLYRDLNGCTFVDRINAALKRANISGDHVDLELIEAIPHLEDRHVEVLQKATQHAIGISIDDCGTGNSAALLRECRDNALPVRTLKMCSGITTGHADYQRREVETWMQRADKLAIRSLIFEGSAESLITPVAIETLQQTRDKMHATIPWYIEGPVFPNGTT